MTIDPRKPLLLLSLPNSGSTWLANLIARHTPWRHFQDEFFNPLRNEKFYDLLRHEFGCELIECYRNIPRAPTNLFPWILRETWGKCALNFTKEVFSPRKLSGYLEKFQCIVLQRDETDSLPPKRLRIWSFYEHAWFAMQEKGNETLIGSPSPRARAVEAFQILQRGMLEDAAALSVPVIRYRDLFGPVEAVRELIALRFGDYPALVDAIVETRLLTTR